jgi:hypothetical protein
MEFDGALGVDGYFSTTIGVIGFGWLEEAIESGAIVAGRWSKLDTVDNGISVVSSPDPVRMTRLGESSSSLSQAGSFMRCNFKKAARRAQS